MRIIGRPLARTALSTTLTNRLTQDLRVLGRTREEHLAKCALAGLVGLLWAPVTAALMSAGGVQVSLVFPLWMSVVLGFAGLATPGLGARSGRLATPGVPARSAVTSTWSPFDSRGR